MGFTFLFPMPFFCPWVHPASFLSVPLVRGATSAPRRTPRPPLSARPSRGTGRIPALSYETKLVYGVAFVLINPDRLKLAQRSVLGYIFTPLMKDTRFTTLLLVYFWFLFQSLRTSKNGKRTAISRPSKIKIEQ